MNPEALVHYATPRPPASLLSPVPQSVKCDDQARDADADECGYGVHDGRLVVQHEHIRRSKRIPPIDPLVRRFVRTERFSPNPPDWPDASTDFPSVIGRIRTSLAYFRLANLGCADFGCFRASSSIKTTKSTIYSVRATETVAAWPSILLATDREPDLGKRARGFECRLPVRRRALRSSRRCS